MRIRHISIISLSVDLSFISLPPVVCVERRVRFSTFNQLLMVTFQAVCIIGEIALSILLGYQVIPGSIFIQRFAPVLTLYLINGCNQKNLYSYEV